MDYLLRNVDDKLWQNIKATAALKGKNIKNYIVELLSERSMDYSIDSALANEHIELIQRRTFNSYSFTVGKLSPVVTIRTYKEENGKGYLFEMSHTIHTPDQVGPYYPGRPWGDYEGYAVMKAITAITDFYRIAVENGHAPSDDWLVKNEQFKEI